MNMNLAVPPFDDVHVRRAVNWVVDKAAMLRVWQKVSDPTFQPLTGQIATHISLDSQENDLLQDYDPYMMSGYSGSVQRAMEKMRRSRYDRNGDGRCDEDVCRSILTLTDDSNFPAPFGATPASSPLMAEVKARFAKIGLDLDMRPAMDNTPFFTKNLDVPAKKVPLGLGGAWSTDLPAAENLMSPLFRSSSLTAKNNNNMSLLGASPGQLRRWGYDVRSVPTVDGRIDQCVPSVGSASFQCWARLDQYLMETVVPWVPYLTVSTVRIVSSRVAHYSFDQAMKMPALDQIAATREATASDNG